MTAASTIKIISAPIDVLEVIDAVRDFSAGAIDVFIGTTRNQDGGKEVVALDYDAYVPMALKVMEEIVKSVATEHGTVKIAVVHRIGRVETGMASVVIAVSAPHRAEAFSACRAVIDRLKHDVPIWKKEIYSDGGVWVGGPA
jgi:molybdopterin synthase catalytic subunit